MMNWKMEKIVNKQINAEMYSSYLYLSMSAHFESKALKGMANWMRVQAQEEMVHAMKFYNFVLNRGGKVALTAIDAPKTEWATPLEVFEDVLKHEIKVTGLIHGLVDKAIAEKDHAANTFLQWFVNEQIEEEASAQQVIDKLRLAGDSSGAMFMMDQELGQRVFVPPVQSAGA